MQITQRQVAIGLQIVMLTGTLLMGVYMAFLGNFELAIPAMAGLLVGLVFAYVYWRGWRYGNLSMVVLGTVLSGVIPPSTDFTREVALSLLLPAAGALILGRPWWVPISVLAAFGVFLLRSGGTIQNLDPLPFLMLGMITGGMVLARLVTDAALSSALEHGEQALAERAEAERRAAEAAAANLRLEEHINEQQRLLDLVATLETPTVSLADGVLLIPIVGHLDPHRAGVMRGRLLEMAHHQRAHLIVMDIAGVATLDQQAAQALIETTQALRLLGCKVALSGISSQVARTMVGLNIDLQQVMTIHSPQEVLTSVYAAA